jgi:hypothetical protein
VKIYTLTAKNITKEDKNTGEQLHFPAGLQTTGKPRKGRDNRRNRVANHSGGE